MGVGEEGTEGVAATAGIATFHMLVPDEHLVVDHPFLFFTRHNLSPNTLSLGRLSSPWSRGTTDQAQGFIPPTCNGDSFHRSTIELPSQSKLHLLWKVNSVGGLHPRTLAWVSLFVFILRIFSDGF